MIADRVFRRYKQRFLPWAIVTAACCGMAGAVMMVAFGAAGLLAWLAAGALLLDRCVLMGNGWLRRNLAQRLEALGEPADTRAARFVGLSHPVLAHRLGHAAETDDDVGFLTLGLRGLVYHGDSHAFTIPVDAIEDVRWVRSLHAPWGRVEVRIADGEPFDAIILDSRDHNSHVACRHDTQKLYDGLRQMLATSRKLNQRRLSAEEAEVVSLLA